ncbi:MAG: HEAT repeat domain-containing protein [Pyrinomonadaceae bacterium]
MSDARPHMEGNGDRTGNPGAPPARRRRSPWPLVVVAVLFVVVPFLTWYWTWFGRSLSDEEIEQYLVEGKPRHAQHALSQVAERIERGDAGAGRWNAQVAALASSPSPDVRMTAAWVMGIEHSSQEFREALARLVEDPEPIVRRNAALALVRFGDERCRPELLAMLRPYTVNSSDTGTALTALTIGSRVKRESLLLRFKTPAGETGEVRSPLPGTVELARVKEGDVFKAGAELFVIAPDAAQVSDALTALSFFGKTEDLADVERYAQGVEGMPSYVRIEAAKTAELIRRRAEAGR